MRMFNFLIKVSQILLICLAISCNSTKNNTNKDETITSSTKKIETNLIMNGYSLGTISINKESDCSFIIIDEKSNSKFDPINIEEEKFSIFLKDEKKIYFKYLSLRRMNRCPDALPIKLLDIKKRED